MSEAMLRGGDDWSGDDLAAMARLHAASFPDEPWSAATLAEMRTTPGTRLLSAQDPGGTMVGFAMLRTVLDEAELLTICVAAASRRSGAGGALLRAAIRAIVADGANSLFLEVAEDNLAALSLYRRAGFIEIGKRRGYYRRGAIKTDALVMKLSELEV